MTSPTIRRRGFLQTIAVTAGATGMSTVFAACDSAGSADPAVIFPQSVASGDPRTDSIVLWTRVQAESGAPMGDVAVRVEVATDEAFVQRVALATSEVMARADSDYCLRVRLTGLTAATRYYYRFEFEGTYSRTGRFKTAAASEADVPFSFALLSCQDYVGRYYNSLLKLLEPAYDDLDVIIHVGDYVYETTGDPNFMMASATRGVTFSDVEGALALGDSSAPYYAARSVSNYRELYRTYRSDATLQRLHEKFAFIVIWDDHEFSDDCWQDNATYSGGRLDEEDTERRRNSEQVFFEYQPIARTDEMAAGALQLARTQLFPENRIYRDFRFGRHAHLMMTDYRSYRPDHLIPESAWPGEVALTEARIRAVFEAQLAAGMLPAGATVDQVFEGAGFRPYIDLSLEANAPYRLALTALLSAGYQMGGASESRATELAAQAVSGLADAGVINTMLEDNAAALPAPIPPIDLTDTTLSRGVSYAMLGKTSLFGEVGSRYIVLVSTYNLLAADRMLQALTSGVETDPFGTTQRQFITDRVMANQDATWTLFGSSVSFSPLVLDLSSFAALLPPQLPATELYLNVDHWDGFPLDKQRWINTLLAPRNAIVLSGDIHAAFLTEHPDSMGNRAIELTCPSVSSGSLADILRTSAASVAGLSDSTLVNTLIGALDSLLTTSRETIHYAKTGSHGVVTARVDGTEMQASFHLIQPEVLTQSYYDRAAEVSFQTVSWRVRRENGVNSAPEMITS